MLDQSNQQNQDVLTSQQIRQHLLGMLDLQRDAIVEMSDEQLAEIVGGAKISLVRSYSDSALLQRARGASPNLSRSNSTAGQLGSSPFHDSRPSSPASSYSSPFHDSRPSSPAHSHSSEDISEGVVPLTTMFPRNGRPAW
jgi:hypothetical protein